VDPARVARGILRLIAEERPVVLLIDNLHLAQPAMLKFLEGASESLRDAPVLLICVANLELAQNWKQWGENVHNATSIELDPLLAGEADELIRSLLPDGSVDSETLEQIRDQTGRNPLLVKHFVTMLGERGYLRLEGQRWIPHELDKAPSTPWIDAVLGSRLDGLPEPERMVIERAALVGKQFSLDEILVLLDEDRARVLEALQVLVGKELLQEDGPGQQRFGFPHALIRDVAYRRIATEERARLHERYGEWRSAQSNGTSNPNVQQTLGLHYDKASSYWSGIAGAEAREKQMQLAGLAGSWLLKAGEFYLESGNFAASLEVLDRATMLLPESHEARPLAFLRLAEALRDTGGANPAAAYRRALRAAKGNDSHIERYARLGLAEMQWATHIQTDEATSHGELDSIIQAFEHPADQRGLAEAWRLRAYIHAATGASKRALDAAEHARRLAAELQDERLEARIRRIRDIILYWGPWSCDLIEPQLEESVTWARSYGMFSLEAAATGILARIAAMRGADDQARAHLETMKSVTENQYETLTPSSAAMSEGLVELYANDFPSAEKPLRRAYNELRGTSRIDVAALLGRVLARMQRWDEVELLAAKCQRAAAGSNHDTEVKRTELQALVFASRGEYEVAQEHADMAVRLGERSQHFDTHAEPLVTKAEVLRQQGAFGPARSAAEEALQRYQAKGDQQSVARVEQLLVSLQK
jgi:hypothetical protein